MGIKEYFKQTIGNEQGNIRDIKIETGKKQKELPFDPERDITEEDWRKMLANLEDMRKSDWMNFLRDAVAMKILFPERAKQLGLDEPIWQQLKERVDRAPDQYTKLWQKMKLKLSFPERVNEKWFIDYDWREVERAAASFRNEYLAFLEMALAIIIIAPNKQEEVNQKLNGNKALWQKVLEELEANRKEKAYERFAWLAALVKILYPSRVAELKLDRIDWQGMKKALQKTREWDWMSFPWQAIAMKILAAHKVEVTDEGLEITMRDPAEEFREQREPMPVRKKF